MPWQRGDGLACRKIVVVHSAELVEKLHPLDSYSSVDSYIIVHECGLRTSLVLGNFRGTHLVHAKKGDLEAVRQNGPIHVARD